MVAQPVMAEPTQQYHNVQIPDRKANKFIIYQENEIKWEKKQAAASQQQSDSFWKKAHKPKLEPNNGPTMWPYTNTRTQAHVA